MIWIPEDETARAGSGLDTRYIVKPPVKQYPMLQRFNSMGLDPNNSNNMENPPLAAVSYVSPSKCWDHDRD